MKQQLHCESSSNEKENRIPFICDLFLTYFYREVEFMFSLILLAVLRLNKT